MFGNVSDCYLLDDGFIAIELWDPFVRAGVEGDPLVGGWLLEDRIREALTNAHERERLLALVRSLSWADEYRHGDLASVVKGLVETGRLRARLVTAAWQREARLPDPHTDPVEPKRPTRPSIKPESRPVWISIELVHEAGLSTENVEVEVTTANGRELYGKLDADGRWRSDEIDRGSCRVRFFDHPVLQPRDRPFFSRKPLHEDEIAWRAGSNRVIDLRPEAHYRIVIVQPPRLYLLSA